ncbi:MAG TPA: NDP-sugar synthase [Terriglobales bacterium]|nr:NDP-sugar synthase [Terriglobales bacterium]
MKAAILAAGLGERLQQVGIATPKPLLPVAGKALIDHTLAGVVAAGLTTVAGIVNEIHDGVEEHCRQRWPELRFEWVRRTTPSSMESLFALAPLLDEPFLLLTVDAIVAPDVLAEFVAMSRLRWPAADGVLALTSFVDDEKPLWVRRREDGRLIELGADAAGSDWITSGFYLFRPTIFAEIEAARCQRFTALRQFLGHLLARGCDLRGAVVGKTVDVDRPEDVATAEAFIAAGYR